MSNRPFNTPLRTHRQSAERGNVLWFIMIGIVLLAALTMIMSRSSTTIDQSGDVEQQRVRSGQILRYAKSLESAIDQMRFSGVSENSISFENNVTSVDYTNTACPSGPCRLFDVSGAGLQYMPSAPGANDGSEWIFTGANNVGSAAAPVGTSGAQTGNDLIMLLPNVSSALCLQINRELKVGTPGTLPNAPGGVQTTPFTGVFDDNLHLLDGTAPTYELANKSAGCFVDTNDSNKIYFYYVLLAR